MITLTFYPDDFRKNEVGMTWEAFLLSLGINDVPPEGKALEAVTLHVTHTHLEYAQDAHAVYDADPGSMDGDHESALASVGWGTDEDYGGSGDERL